MKYTGYLFAIFRNTAQSISNDQTALETELNSKVDGAAGVKIYRALLTQSSTDAPVATVLENSLGGTLVWAYSAQGIYTATLAGAFTANKTFLPPGNFNDGANIFHFSLLRTSANVVTLYSFDRAGNGLVDEALNNTSIEILVYP